jgi:hydrogenase expression/formation protein HypE
MQDTHISLAHGNGGRYMRELIDELFARHLANPLLDTRVDAARIELDADRDVFVTTDGFTVKPLEFPGGDIGSLAVHGTVNDLSVAGAVPRYLTLNAYIEEGLEVALLDRLVASLARAARECGVAVVAGDTKVVARGEGGGLYLATTGIGVRRRGIELGMDRVRAGDAVLVSGPVGDHGTAVMLAREQFGLRGDLVSDSGPVLDIAQALLGVEGLRFMRDPTRGGLASVTNELVHATGLSVRLREADVPVRDPVRSVCEMLGYDPYYLACEGRLVAVVAAAAAGDALARMSAAPGGAEAALIGGVEAPQSHARVVLETTLGGERVLEELEDDPLPRIC